MDRNVIIFDLDGVLFDTVDFMYGLTKGEYDELSHEEFKELHKGNIYESFKKFARPKRQETEEAREKRYTEYSKLKSTAHIHTGMRDLVMNLAQNNNLILNTSASIQNSVPLLEQEGILKNFSFLATREVSSSKIEKFKIIAEKFGKKPHEMIFITDTIGDLRESHIAKVPTLAVTWGLHKREDFGEEHCENLLGFVDSAKELEKTIKTLFNEI